MYNLFINDKLQVFKIARYAKGSLKFLSNDGNKKPVLEMRLNLLDNSDLNFLKDILPFFTGGEYKISLINEESQEEDECFCSKLESIRITKIEDDPLKDQQFWLSFRWIIQ